MTAPLDLWNLAQCLVTAANVEDTTITGGHLRVCLSAIDPSALIVIDTSSGGPVEHTVRLEVPPGSAGGAAGGGGAVGRWAHGTAAYAAAHAVTTVDRATTGTALSVEDRAAHAVQLAATALELYHAALAPSTLDVYRRRWVEFERWCRDVAGVPSLPAAESTLIAFVAHLAQQERTPSTVEGYLAAVKWRHEDDGAPWPGGPSLARVTTGHRRQRGTAPTRRAAGLQLAQLQRIVGALDPCRPVDVRDGCAILFGFVTGLRRSELVAVYVEHLELHPEGLTLLVPRGKSDQEGKGRSAVLPYGTNVQTCPVTAYQRWREVSGVTEGRVFRAVRRNGKVWGEGITPQVYAGILRRRALAVGLPGNWSGHSTRRGFATTAARNGVPRHQIMRDGGWHGDAVDVYLEEGTQWEGRAAQHLGT